MPIEPELLNAIRAQNEEKVTELLNEASTTESFNPNYIQGQYDRANPFNGLGFLHLAVIVRNLPIFNKVLAIPDLDVNLLTKPVGSTAFYLAITDIPSDPYVRNEMIKALLAIPTIDVNKKPQVTNHGFGDANIHFTPFDLMAKKLNAKIVKLIANHPSFNLALTNLSGVLSDIVFDLGFKVLSEQSKINSVEVIHLLLNLGAGINCTLEDNLPENVCTDNTIFIGNITIDKKPCRITREIHGFENAITNKTELINALQNCTLSSISKLIISCEVSLADVNCLYKEEIIEIRNILENYQFSLRKRCLEFIATSTHPKVQNLSSLPNELQEKVEATRKMLLNG